MAKPFYGRIFDSHTVVAFKPQKIFGKTMIATNAKMSGAQLKRTLGNINRMFGRAFKK